MYINMLVLFELLDIFKDIRNVFRMLNYLEYKIKNIYIDKKLII